MAGLDSIKNMINKAAEENENFNPHCEVDDETEEIFCNPEWDRGEYVEEVDSPIRLKVLSNKTGEDRLQILGTGDASEECFNKTFDFVAENTPIET